MEGGGGRGREERKERGGREEKERDIQCTRDHNTNSNTISTYPYPPSEFKVQFQDTFN